MYDGKIITMLDAAALAAARETYSAVVLDAAYPWCIHCRWARRTAPILAARWGDRRVTPLQIPCSAQLHYPHPTTHYHSPCLMLAPFAPLCCKSLNFFPHRCSLGHHRKLYAALASQVTAIDPSVYFG